MKAPHAAGAADLGKIIEELKRVTEELSWKTAFLEAKINSSIDGILVVNEQGRKILQNQRLAELLKIPEAIANDEDDAKQLQWVTDATKDAGRFLEKVVYLNTHPQEISRDEVELKDGTILDRYSSPVVDKDGKYYGRIWTFRDITKRKRSEAALVESESRYHSLFENMVEGYAYCETLFEGGQLRDFIYLEVNEAFEKLTGLKNVVGKKVSEVIPGIQETNPQLFEIYRRVALTGKPEKCEIYIAALGIWFSVTVYSREKGHFVAIFDNITVRKEAAMALAESDEKFRQLADNITDVFWIRSPDMRKLHYISPAFERIWGRPMASLEANPRQWVDFIVPEDRDWVVKAFAGLTSGARNLDVEYRIMRPDGEIRWVRVRGFQVRDAADEVIRNIGIVTDITERKIVAEELRESDWRFRDMLQNLDMVAIMLDRSARITYCNDYLLRLTGWRREEVIGREWFGIFLPPQRVGEMQEFFSALLAEHPDAWHNENEIITRTGAQRLIRWNNSVLRSASGAVIGTASVGEDVTGRKRLEAQFVQSQKMEMVGKLAGGIAHEFNSIMTAVIGQSELMLNDLPAKSPLRENATEIRMAADRAAALTRQLLAFGRKQILQPEILDLKAVLAGMESLLHHIVGGNVDLRLLCDPGLKAVKADAGQIQQVIANIVMNAAEAMPNGGKLTVEATNVELDEDYVRNFADLKAGGYAMIAITDTGAGMSAEIIARIFEPFFTTKEVGEGPGLGLATSHGIIKQSNGHIAVYSEPGLGATFKIYLPEVELTPRISPPPPAPGELPHGTETVLLVEDNPALREMAATLLGRLGYAVLAAGDGIEALVLIQKKGAGHIDLLFTDVVMPRMSGRELGREVQMLFPQTKILFASAYPKNSIVHQGSLDPDVELLQKPFTPLELAHKVRKVLDS